jgi:hypothetical protein
VVRRNSVGPRLEALLDERDHLRIRISLDVENPDASDKVALMRRRLLELDREIIKHWGTDESE